MESMTEREEREERARKAALAKGYVALEKFPGDRWHPEGTYQIIGEPLDDADNPVRKAAVPAAGQPGFRDFTGSALTLDEVEAFLDGRLGDMAQWREPWTLPQEA